MCSFRARASTSHECVATSSSFGVCRTRQRQPRGRTTRFPYETASEPAGPRTPTSIPCASDSSAKVAEIASAVRDLGGPAAPCQIQAGLGEGDGDGRCHVITSRGAAPLRHAHRDTLAVYAYRARMRGFRGRPIAFVSAILCYHPRTHCGHCGHRSAGCDGARVRG